MILFTYKDPYLEEWLTIFIYVSREWVRKTWHDPNAM